MGYKIPCPVCHGKVRNVLRRPVRQCPNYGDSGVEPESEHLE